MSFASRSLSCFLQKTAARGKRAPFIAQSGKFRVDRGAARDNDQPKTGRQEAAVQTENFPQTTAHPRSFDGGTGPPRGDNTQTRWAAVGRGEGTEDHEASVP
jgi:hypothetical protein